VRENRTHGSEGGDGESRSRPLSLRNCWSFTAALKILVGFLK